MVGRSGEKKQLRFGVVCSSNMNRSMEAHSFLSKKGFSVRSFGTANQVKLPGPTADKPNYFDFSMTYLDIYKELAARDKTLYTQNGMLYMLDRNRRIKPGPERFQTSRDEFDVLITCEERCYDQVVDHLEVRGELTGNLVHVVNIDVLDNHEEATIGAFFICELCQILEDCDDLDNEIDKILTEFETRTERSILHTVGFY